MSLSSWQKRMAIAASTAAVMSTLTVFVGFYVSAKVDAKIAPVSADLAAHKATPGHEQSLRMQQQLLEEMQKNNKELGYIRGRIDEKWGQK